MNQVAIKQDEPEGNVTGFLAMIERVAADPKMDVSKLEKLLDMQERIMGKQAEISFNQAMARLQPALPVIKHNSVIKHGEKVISTYAKYEDIDAQIRPLYSAEGFSLSFTSKQTEDGKVVYYGTISHKEGHSRTAEMVLPADGSGAKNAIQAVGSTISYAKRYLVTMLLNLVTSGEDDDGEGASDFVTTEQAAEIDTLWREAKADQKKFLAFMGVDDVRKILAKDYHKALNALNAKKAESAKAPSEKKGFSRAGA